MYILNLMVVMFASLIFLCTCRNKKGPEQTVQRERLWDFGWMDKAMREPFVLECDHYLQRQWESDLGKV